MPKVKPVKFEVGDVVYLKSSWLLVLFLQHYERYYECY